MNDGAEHPSATPAPVSRRNVLRMAGVGVVGAAAAGASQLVPQAAVASSQEEAPLAVTVHDYIDRHYVVQVTLGSGPGAPPVRERDGLQIIITEGAAEVREDRYTGRLLVHPLPGEAVTIRAMAPGSNGQLLSSLDTNVGYDASEVSTIELAADAVGGGACKSGIPTSTLESIMAEMGHHISRDRQAVLAALPQGEIESSLQVRAAVMANVIPVNPSERTIRWQHARYYGRETVLGLLRFTYDPNRDSRLILQSGGGSFFPATGVNSIYCRMEILELGASAFSIDPLLLPSNSVTWPPYSTPMSLLQPVAFYDESKPEQLVMTILENEMSLYDYNGISIIKQGSQITADGTLHAGFKVTNQTEQVLTGRWVMIGNHLDQAFAQTDAPIALGPAGTSAASTEVDVKVPVGRSELSQRVAFAVMGLSDPLALGISSITFRYPDV